MKNARIFSAAAFLAFSLVAGLVEARQDESAPFIEQIVEVELADKEVLKGRICLPAKDDSGLVPTLVIFVHGTGPGTYLNKRQIGSKTFNYFDMVAEKFCERGVGFFSYNKRGVTMGDQAPWFDEVDREKFRTVVPSVESQDLASIIDSLRKNERLANSRVVLLGWSEGTMIAAMAAEKYPDRVDALFLAGYAHENLYDIIETQFSGHSSMLNLNPVFDANDDGKISKEEYESDDEKIARYRKGVMQGTGFDVLDATKDGWIDAEDFAIRTKPVHEHLLKCVSNGDEEWIWANYFRISIPWLKEHFALEPNKTRLTRLNLPIYIFHGTADAHVRVEGVRDLERRFKALGKTSLTAHVFEGHDHDLNFLQWLTKDEWPDGWAKIMEVASGLNDPKK